jgi:hypothetical protein
MKPIDKSEVDVMCIYCPETDDCYYLQPQDFGQSVTLRLGPSANGQLRGVHRAADFRTFPDTPRSLRCDDVTPRQDGRRPRHV